MKWGTLRVKSAELLWRQTAGDLGWLTWGIDWQKEFPGDDVDW